MVGPEPARHLPGIFFGKGPQAAVLKFRFSLPDSNSHAMFPSRSELRLLKRNFYFPLVPTDKAVKTK